MSRAASSTAGLINAQWVRAPAAEYLTLGSEEVHIWRCRLNNCSSSNILSEDEQERAERFANGLARARFVASRVFLRLTLSRYLDLPANALRFAVAPGGKPCLDTANSTPEFNLSHTGDLALLAVAEHAVGVDVESESARDNFHAIARRVFLANDVAKLEVAENPALMFVGLWTQYEARQKAFGEGIFGRQIEPTAVRSASFSAGSGFCAAVAVADLNFLPRLRFFDFPIPP